MKTFVIGFCAIMCCSGCFGPTLVKITDRYPVYAMPIKSEIAKISEEDIKTLSPETKKKIIDSINSLKSETIQLRTILESYNEYANKHNLENK